MNIEKYIQHIFFKPHGFNLIEVMFAIALVSAIGAPLLMLNYNVLLSTGRTSELAERTILLERILQEQALAKAEPLIKKDIKIDEPLTEIVYERTTIPATSQLATFKEAQLIKVTASWQSTSGGSRTETLVTFAIMPHEAEGNA